MELEPRDRGFRKQEIAASALNRAIGRADRQWTVEGEIPIVAAEYC